MSEKYQTEIEDLIKYYEIKDLVSDIIRKAFFVAIFINFIAFFTGLVTTDFTFYFVIFCSSLLPIISEYNGRIGMELCLFRYIPKIMTQDSLDYVFETTKMNKQANRILHIFYLSEIHEDYEFGGEL